MGYYSVLAGKILATQGGVVHAIEMDADNANRIRKNLRLNNLRNVSIHEVALGDHVGSVEYYRCGSFRNTLEVSSDEQDQYSIASVLMTTSDLLVAEQAINPEIIKIDVEGAEYIVLQGMEKLLSESQLEIYCEVHIDETNGGLASFGHSINDVWKILERHNYRIWEIPLRKDSKQSNIRIINDVREIIESTMLYASNVQ
jgi:FkbM family methyltransferase